MKRSHRRLALLLAAAGTAAALGLASLTPREVERVCFAVDRDGYGPVEIPCPEYYEGEFLSSFLSAQSNDSDEMAIDPQWPWDQAMLAERDWPHDQAIVREVPPGSELQPGDSASRTANRAITIVRGVPRPPIRLKAEAPE